MPTIYTILFLDEANTTEAIGLVKEILCDRRIKGKPLDPHTGLKIIAACNPYRRHSDEMIEKLKKAGLGYNVGEDETTDKFGKYVFNFQLLFIGGSVNASIHVLLLSMDFVYLSY